jgi:hypothetical protein
MTNTKSLTAAICTAGLICLGATAGAQAKGVCPQRRETVALKAAEVQQALMVAALSCRQTHAYNRFVLAYRAELQHSDAVLRRYFEHRYGHRGMRAYHAYKTKLANAASLRSLRDIRHYCAEARRTFRDALDDDHLTLAGLAVRYARGHWAACSRRERMAESRR